MDTTLRDPLVGQLLDHRYRVESRLAVGGMATVYKALDTRLDRVMALKVMHPALAADGEFVARFIREAKAVARLSHANVVAVYDQGRDGDHVFLAMEFIDGCTLRDIIGTRGALTPRVALDILEPVVAALGAAHRAGLVHRDVKPENVLIAADGRVKVADFGLVRAVTGGTNHTTAGTVLGTVAYLAPEQIEYGTADQRTDVFACGLLLYELLTGVRAQEGATPSQAMYKRVNEPVPVPSLRLPGLAPELDALIGRTTALAPDARPADAIALLALVQATRRALTEAQLDREPPAAPVPVREGAAGEEGPQPIPGTTDPTTQLAAGLPPVNPTRVQALPSDIIMPVPVQWHDDNTAVHPVGTPPPGEPPRHRGWRPPHPKRAAAILVAVLVLGGGLTWYTVAGRYTAAPAVLGLTRSEAAAKLDKAGLHPAFVQRFSESVQPGRVVSTDPGAGGNVQRGGTVDVVLSKGPERFAVPDVKGAGLAQATQALKARHLIVGRVERAFSSSVPAGQVLSSNPAAGSSLAAGTAVDLAVSKGSPVQVPDVTGEDLSSAEQDLTDAGFKPVVSPTQVNSPDVAAGQVAKQSPSDVAPQGSKVTLYVSAGAKQVTVPDVTGMKVDEAKKVLKKAGFKASTGFHLFGGNTVKSTSPAAGQQAPEGSTVNLDTGGL
ncbi:hypothetical protein BIV57_17245 [Mangrovactinospora gilvigrisea]|uniref:non-specific serine/threonine protein kinase n=1 Tax=Mangrovactinospora gilvigrisea TaxID=1428644 RepID=A0A1J7BC17_9ACTN|nr:Stk1 family PASTA domain-containing Ser/Thr kinase [Mangrovactinospora gilvigrisea]OIV36239.1 hypothetical protein BIV57_17245 [Mangrovactinospora gilvigrisea]